MCSRLPERINKSSCPDDRIMLWKDRLSQPRREATELKSVSL